MSEEKTSTWRYVVPNLVTSTGVVLALFSVVQSQAGYYEDAAWLILLCVLIDKMDGTAARLLKASSSFGIQLDSFADFISFGLAPAFLILGLFTNSPGHVTTYDAVGGIWFVRGACAFFILMSSFRLAKFNVTTEKIGSKIFLGIPTTLVGGLTSSYFLTVTKYDLGGEFIAVLPVVLLIVGLWEVSNIPLPKLGKTESMPYNIFMASNAVGVYICVPLQAFPEYIFTLGAGYAVIGTGFAFFLMQDEWKKPEAGEANAG